MEAADSDPDGHFDDGIAGHAWRDQIWNKQMLAQYFLKMHPYSGLTRFYQLFHRCQVQAIVNSQKVQSIVDG